MRPLVGAVIVDSVLSSHDYGTVVLMGDLERAVDNVVMRYCPRLIADTVTVIARKATCL